ncbi:MAG: TolC family protein [Pseudomonadota bacterium]|nr:TolC family protein [Pseudomonadota bacterium]
MLFFLLPRGRRAVCSLHWRLSWIAIACWLSPSFVFAAAPDDLASALRAAPAANLTLDDAVGRTLERNTLLRADNASVDSARRQAELDGLAPPLTIGAELENVAGTGAVSGIHAAEATLRLGRVFELGAKRSARQELGAAQVARQLNALDRRRLDLAAIATRRFIDVAGKQARLDLAARSVALAGESHKAIVYRVQRGRSPEADLHLAELAVIRAELEHEDATHEVASARVSLAVLWGAKEPDFGRVLGSLDRLPTVSDLSMLAERLHRTPDYRGYALEFDQIDAQARLAATNAKPDLHVTLGVRRFEALDDQALVFSVLMPFGLSQRSTLGIAKHQAERERLEGQRTDAELDAYQTLYGRYQELQHARHEFEALRDRMIPLAEKALASTQAGYDDARFSFLQVAQTRAVLLGLHRDAIEAAARYHQLLADIERATAASGASP